MISHEGNDCHFFYFLPLKNRCNYFFGIWSTVHIVPQENERMYTVLEFFE